MAKKHPSNMWACCAVQVSIGRLSDNSIALSDNEVSGHHAAICWECSCRCWQVGALGA